MWIVLFFCSCCLFDIKTSKDNTKFQKRKYLWNDHPFSRFYFFFILSFLVLHNTFKDRKNCFPQESLFQKPAVKQDNRWFLIISSQHLPCYYVLVCFYSLIVRLFLYKVVVVIIIDNDLLILIYLFILIIFIMI